MEVNTPASQLLVEKQSSELHHISPQETVFAAIEKMADQNVGALLVFEGNQLMGILTERDYTRKVILQGRASKTSKVAEIMTSPVISVEPDTAVNHCMTLMTEKRIRYLPVKEAEDVIGILSIGDIIKHIIFAQSSMIDQLSSYVTGEYPG